jgi:hypothetical protein
MASLRDWRLCSRVQECHIHVHGMLPVSALICGLLSTAPQD